MTKTDQLQDLLAPTVHALGLELLGLEYLPQPGGSLVRLYIDVAGPEAGERTVGIDECEQVSREVAALLDVEDPITGNYTLEVSSPGIERPLFTPAQFARFIGENAKVTLKLPQDGRRRLLGRIVAVEGETIRFDLDGTPFEVAHSNIEKARIAPDWAALGFPAKGTKPDGRSKKAAAGKQQPTTSTGGAGSAMGGVENE
ncbi:ribosome maturation factor RimP [Solilutibacter silvestris]|uniref:Ribosome maturation factor RimP n=1 Tax=Solilutibacter silvestris TaxID=1645665 RepID=A0A2K1PZ26_9GAMM|nr:ribosome maturation factor RimP [Lysobacter silvestris]PNS08041.1 hypothetical protein Lysil_2217 [Lysobacter silvestris]